MDRLRRLTRVEQEMKVTDKNEFVEIAERESARFEPVQETVERLPLSKRRTYFSFVFFAAVTLAFYLVWSAFGVL